MTALTAGSTFKDFIFIFINLVGTAIPLIASLALLAFFWGLVRFIMNVNNPKGLEEGRALMIWGTVALFVMVSVWGLIRFAYHDVGFNTRTFGIPFLPEK